MSCDFRMTYRQLYDRLSVYVDSVDRAIYSYVRAIAREKGDDQVTENGTLRSRSTG